MSWHSVINLLGAAVLALSSGVAHAQWYETLGQAEIRNGNKAHAKNRAVEDAIRQALLFSGGSLSAVQTVANGVLTQDQVKLQAHGDINHVELIEERTQGALLSVLLRINISPKENVCVNSQIKPTLAVTLSHLAQPETARYGQIYEVNQAYTNQLMSGWQTAPEGFLPLDASHKKNRLAVRKQDAYTTQKYLTDLAKQFQAQYVLVSEILDVSMGETPSTGLAFWQTAYPLRHFTTRHSLVNTLTFERIWQKQYHHQGLWPFAKTDKVNPHSGAFWQTDYANAINTQNQQLTAELNQALACAPMHATILARQGNQIHINVGRQNGVTTGMRFYIAHRAHRQTEFGTLPKLETSIYEVEVTQVHGRTAIAKSVNRQFLGGTQVGDLVTLVTPKAQTLFQ